MLENLLTSEGLIAAPSSSKAIEEENMDTSSILEDDLLSQSGDHKLPSFQVPNGTSPQKEIARQSRRKNCEPKKATRTNENPRKHGHSQPPQSAENKMFLAESVIKSLKRHTDKGTCPESLQYRARARIRTDNEFNIDIKSIRKNAEQEFVRALTRFHYHGIKKKSKRPRIVQTSTQNENCTNIAARPAPAACNTDVTITNVKETAGSIQAGIAQFSKMMGTL